MKTTGVINIPKFGLLDFLGHSNKEDQKFMRFRGWRGGCDEEDDGNDDDDEGKMTMIQR